MEPDPALLRIGKAGFAAQSPPLRRLRKQGLDQGFSTSTFMKPAGDDPGPFI